MAFDVAIYTDVLASEAVDGIDGFNFQSTSSAVTGADKDRIRQTLLHRIVSSWAIDNDPLAHPATCAYVVSQGRCYLSRGMSTGRTNNGRDGNQLTQTIITSDPDDFVPYRPAQLFGAAEWTLEKAPSKESDPWVTPLKVKSEFDVPGLEALVLKDEWARAILPQYLTMLDAAVADEPKKLVLIHDDLELVMRWIALGTLFVDADSARVLQFRALVEDPWLVDAAIVGVSSRFAAREMSAANVLNLSEQSLTSIEPSASARIRAAWFLEQGADDALNAIEIARRWEPVLGVGLANDVAQVVGLSGACPSAQAGWRATMAATQALAEAHARDDLALYAEELCDAAVAYIPTSSEEFALAGRAIRAVHDLDVDELASEMLVPTLEALLSTPTAVEAFARELAKSSSPVRWESAGAREAASAFITKLMNSASASALSELFTAGRVIAVPIPDPALADAVRRLADAWAMNPELGRATWQTWLAAPEVLAMTVQSLTASLRVGDDSALGALARGDWDFVGAFTDDSSLHGWLKAAKLAHTPVDVRAESVRTATSIPSEAWRVVLTGSTVPGHARLWGTWIKSHGLPDEMASALKTTIQKGLDDAARSDGGPAVSDWHPLMESLSRATDSDLSAFAGEYLRARAAFKRVRDAVAAHPESPLEGCLPYCQRFAPFLLPDLGWLLLHSSNFEEAGKLLRATGPWGPEAIRRSLLDLAATGNESRAVGHAAVLCDHPDSGVAAAAESALLQVVTARPKLLKMAEIPPRVKSEIKQGSQEQSSGNTGKRWLGGTFSRNKGRGE